MTEGTWTCPPIPPLRLSLWWCIPVQELSQFGGAQSGGGWNPDERLAGDWAFPMKIILFRYDAEIVTTLSISYDDCRRPRRGAPAANRWLKIQKNSLPSRASQRPWGWSLSYVEDFHGTDVNRIDSCLVLQNRRNNILGVSNSNNPFLLKTDPAGIEPASLGSKPKRMSSTPWILLISYISKDIKYFLPII